MDTIRFSARKNENFDPHTLVGEEDVDIQINGREIRDIIREIELPFATRECNPGLAGDYEHLEPKNVYFPNKHFQEEQDDEYLLKDGKVPVL